MRRHSDDDLYRIHSRWLGPAGYTLPFSIPLKGIPAGAAAGVAALMVLRAFGASGLPLWILTAGIVIGAAKLVISVTGPERPVRALAALFASEVSAPRPERNDPQSTVLSPVGIRVRAVTVGRPGRRWRA